MEVFVVPESAAGAERKEKETGAIRAEKKR